MNYFRFGIGLIVSLLCFSCQTTPMGADKRIISYTSIPHSDGGIDFGSNVFIIDPSLDSPSLQNKIDTIYSQQNTDQFGTNRYLFLFKPGTYLVTFPVGFYTHVAGLGTSPNGVSLNGSLSSDAWLPGYNATCNFWRSVENLSFTPTSGTMKWAVSQACPFRRMHVKGNMILCDNNGWSSGGFIADSLIDGQVNSGTQQQWFSRNTEWGGWSGANWNMVFAGINKLPVGNWPNPAYTFITSVPVKREKPYLYVTNSTNYFVFVPDVQLDTVGTTWNNKAEAGSSISIDQFYVAKSAVDTAATINNALGSGKNLLLTPGIYHLDGTIHISRADTVILGMGLATLIPDTGLPAMTVDDVDGVKIAGIIFDAGLVNSPVLLQVGPSNSSAVHSSNPISLHDLFFRIGGALAGKASTSIVINSSDVIGDHFWVWRADHGNSGTVGWNINTAANGLIVNGNNVTIYGLFVEHYQQYETLWNGQNGRTYFYQCEIPYDVPNQASWMSSNNSINGYASYKVANTVTNHEAWGLGIYSVYRNDGISLESPIEVPVTPGVKFHHMVTADLGSGNSDMKHIINDTGNAAGPAYTISTLADY